MITRRERSVIDDAPLLVAPELANLRRLSTERDALTQRLAGLPRRSRRHTAVELRLQATTAQILAIELSLRRRP